MDENGRGARRSAGATVMHVAIVEGPIDVSRLMSLVADAGVGAVSMFLGTVRNSNDGRDVSGIDYQAYQPMAELELTAIANECGREHPGVRLAIEHRVGSLVVGDISVAIAAAHARRAPALRAAAQVIESLKARVPIWKCERYLDGERRWVDPTAA